MTTLTEFLLARIAEDKAMAREARLEEYLTTRDSSGLLVGMRDGYAHVVATSGRVLAECESKRAVVGLLSADIQDRRNALRRSWAAEILIALAQPYADHPDFDPAWAV